MWTRVLDPKLKNKNSLPLSLPPLPQSLTLALFGVQTRQSASQDNPGKDFIYSGTHPSLKKKALFRQIRWLLWGHESPIIKLDQFVSKKALL